MLPFDQIRIFYFVSPSFNPHAIFEVCNMRPSRVIIGDHKIQKICYVTLDMPTFFTIFAFCDIVSRKLNARAKF